MGWWDGLWRSSLQCTLRAGSTRSHTHKEGVKRCQESEPALISVSKFFISALPEQSEIPLVEKTVNLFCLVKRD